MLDNKLIQLITALIIVIAGAVAFGHFLLRYIYGYDIKDGRVRLLLFGFLPIIQIRISEIRDMTEGSTREGWGKLHFGLKLGNRVWGNYLVMERKRGLLRRIVITPDNPREFMDRIEEWKSKNQEARGRG